MLTLILFERAALIILLAYILMSNRHLKQLLMTRTQLKSIISLIILFAIFAILSNLFGVMISIEQFSFSSALSSLSDEVVIANTRVLSIGISGLVGGPIVGSAVGLLSGVFRYFQGGTDPHIYLISSIIIGVLSGWIGHYFVQRQRFLTPVQGGLIAIGLEIIQMACIGFLSRNQATGWNLVQVIFVPMAVVNSIGTGLFLSIIINALSQEENLRAIQTHDVLQLTKDIFPYFHSGLNRTNAKEISELILKTMKVSAVSVTNRDEILAFTGVGSDHHTVGSDLVTDLSQRVISSGEMWVAHSRSEIGCICEKCPLEGAIVVPLSNGKEVIGTLKYYFTQEDNLTEVEQQWAEGLGEIFSSQIQLGQTEAQQHLLKQAELRTLQGQVNPHFFFNSINTISAIMRFDPDKARRLLLKLSQYFRASLTGNRQALVTVEDELQQVQAYTEIEEARFPGRFDISYDISEDMLNSLIPPFLIQILVENAIHHAFKDREENNQINISLKRLNDKEAIFSVSDNGFGIREDILKNLGKETIVSDLGSGTALENLNQRLLGIYGSQSELKFTSSREGTVVAVRFKIFESEEEWLE
ncbi:LytS/YhcK type 5TM receptor domain-containing protein [Fundicoccus sp. Sow4_F4]|uniref:LytS/YhcK type 5TM receptor domain-containing protein n=1 Tax=Fundicoccus sp. Sow4_F4 TaxID=3438783 RepID=UPI003F92A09C